jgi:hypothetical protein
MERTEALNKVYDLIWYEWMGILPHLDLIPPWTKPAENRHLAVEVSCEKFSTPDDTRFTKDAYLQSASELTVASYQQHFGHRDDGMLHASSANVASLFRGHDSANLVRRFANLR